MIHRTPAHASGTLAALSATLLALSCAAPRASEESIRTQLFEIERESHQQWLRGDVAALDALMDDAFHFVAMNGAVETRAEIIGDGPEPAAPRPLQVSRLEVEPEELLLHDDTAIVIALMRIDATVAGRTVPDRMRILSVFRREGRVGDWRLVARSITPLLPPPEPGPAPAPTASPAPAPPPAG